MARRSVIEMHPRRAEIESAIASGVQGKIIARQYDVSESAISRWRNSAMAVDADQSADEKTDSPGSADALIRLFELAESTRRARKLADRTGSPTVKAAAQRAELAVLDRLFTKLGITDLSVLYWSATAHDLYGVLVQVLQDRPDIRADVLALMSKRIALKDLAESLAHNPQETR